MHNQHVSIWTATRFTYCYRLLLHVCYGQLVAYFPALRSLFDLPSEAMSRIRERQKKVKLKAAREAHSTKDIFNGGATCALECAHGDRVITAHMRRFETATEEMVQAVWDASTSRIVQNWENFVLAQLLDATQLMHSRKTGDLSDELEWAPCEICLRGTADSFAKNLKVSKVSSDSTSSTPPASRADTPPIHSVPSSSLTAEKTISSRQLSRPLRIWALSTIDLKIYVTSAYIHLLKSSPRSICEDTPSIYTSLFLNFMPSEQSLFPPGSNPVQHLSVYTLLLDKDSQDLLRSENAGGSSLESEVIRGCQFFMNIN